MFDNPLLEELYQIRCRISEECGHDMHRYCEMLKEVEKEFPGNYISEPLRCRHTQRSSLVKADEPLIAVRKKEAAP